MIFVKAAWLVCATMVIAHGSWLRGHGGNLGDITTVLFWQLMILGFPSALAGYCLSFAVFVLMHSLIGKPEAGGTLVASMPWLLLHVVTAAFGYWQWFVFFPRWKARNRRTT